MSAVNVNALYPIFTDIDGQPLEDGYVWIGVSGLEPQANPQTAYWDAALTQVATQPVRTRGGYPLNGAAIGRLFTGAPYSIKVQNKRTSTIATDLSASAGAGVGSISFGTTGLTPAVPTDGDVVVAGTLAVANGGTGVTTATGTGSVVLSASPTVTGPTVSSGNLAFSGTAQRITGDFSNATQSSRLAFQTSTVNGNTAVAVLPNGTSTTGSYIAFNNSDPTNAGFVQIQALSTEARLNSSITGTGTYLPMAFQAGGGEAMRIQTSRNVSIGSTADNGNLFVSGANSRVRFANTAGTASTLLFGADSASVFLGAETNAPIYFITNNTERVRVDTSGNVGIGRAPSYTLDVYRSGTTTPTIAAANDNIVTVMRASGSTEAVIGPITSHPLVLLSANVERMRIDASGNVLIGSDAASGTGRLQVFAPDGGATIRVMRFSNDASPAQLLLRKNRGAAATSFTAVQSGDNCGNIVGQGADGSAYGNLGSIAFNADGNASAGSTPGLISFATTPSGSNTSTERLRISASGNVVQGTAAVATNATAGFLWITSCAGAPTGAPTAPYTNAAAMVCDTTNNRLYVLVGATWRYAALI